jgi:signal peptidase II
VARRYGILAVVALGVVVLDQVTKSWAVHALADRDIHVVWTLRFHLIRNSGASFSLVPGRGGLVAIGAIVVVGVLAWLGRNEMNRASAVALGLVLGGALGNLVDRAFRDGSGLFGGAVVDFIDLQWWPVFNIADASVTVGAIALILLRRDAARHHDAAQ